MEILRQHETQGIVAVVFDKPRLDPRRLACFEAVAAVEDQAFVNRDRLDEAVRPDVGDERGEGFAVQQRQKVGERMKPESHLWSFPMPPAPAPGADDRDFKSSRSRGLKRLGADIDRHRRGRLGCCFFQISACSFAVTITRIAISRFLPAAAIAKISP